MTNERSYCDNDQLSPVAMHLEFHNRGVGDNGIMTPCIDRISQTIEGIKSKRFTIILVLAIRSLAVASRARQF